MKLFLYQLLIGKWQYELQLESKGVMQLGWSSYEAEFTTETGVGMCFEVFNQ